LLEKKLKNEKEKFGALKKTCTFAPPLKEKRTVSEAAQTR
jgi:hypothetical protein